MKKLLSAMIALVLLVSCAAFAASAEEKKVLRPFNDPDAAAIAAAQDITVNASLSALAVNEEEGTLTLDIHVTDFYRKEDLLALQPGDVIYANNEEIVIETLAWDELNIWLDINGGFFEGDCASFYALPGVCGEGIMISQQYDDITGTTALEPQAFKLAEQVTVSTFRWGEDGEPDDEMDVAVLTPDQVKDYLQQVEDKDFFFGYSNTTVRIVDGQITEITLNWAPYA
ncbi:MAG: hypothetical protein CW338_03960 [Clostridiales bacterium]|nr:hypothetical protein [Clostridiales bacterium]